MRKLNTITTILIAVCFLVYVLEGVYLLVSGADTMIGGRYVMDVILTITTMHVLVGFILSFNVIEAIRRTGFLYVKENASYWVRRISAVLMLVFLFCQKLNEVFPLLYVLSVVIHMVASVKPVLIEMGIKNYKRVLLSTRVALATMGVLSAAEYTILLCQR